MLSKVSNILTKNIYFVSRQKVLLKRRKITSKKQKVAKKKFLEQNPNGNYTNELKILQIQKELDRRVNKNQHLNQLMDELFYPDVRYANQKILQQNLLKFSTSPQQNMDQRNKNKGRHGQENEQFQEFDKLVQQIYLCQIPSQFFELYLKNSQLFTQRHLSIYFQRLDYYFKNKSLIQDRVTYKWKLSLEKLKLTDAQKKKKRRCPYIFIEQDQLIRDEQWNKVVKDIYKKISITTAQIANQNNQENLQQTQQNHVDQSFYSLESNCDLVLLIKSSADYIPDELFNAIVKKMLVIVNLNQNSGQKLQQRLPIFSHQEKVKLLQVLSFKGMAKSTLTKTLHIETPDESQRQEQKVIAVGKKICQDILKSRLCSSEDLGVVIRSSKGQFKFLNTLLLQLSKQQILKFLTSTNLQRSIDCMNVFWQNGSTKDVGFIQVLLFDIYRKLPFSSSKYHIMTMINMIKDRRIFFRETQVTVTVSQIYPRLIETAIKYLNENQLSHEEVKTLLNSIYINYPLYKIESMLNVLEIIATAIVKIGDGFKLQEITNLLFKITVMGHSSKIFSKYVFQRYQKEYKKLMKHYKQSKIQLITDKSSKSSAYNQNDDNIPSISEVKLEQNLIMMLWSFLVSFSRKNASLPLSQMIQIYPIYIRSQDQMISNLIEDLNLQLKEYNFFPLIKNKDLVEVTTKDNKRKQLRAVSLLLKTNTSQQFKYRYNHSVAIELLEKLEEGKQPIKYDVFNNLIAYLMRYCILSQGLNQKSHDLTDRWNESVKEIFNNRKHRHEKIKEDFMNFFNSNQQKRQNSQNTIARRIMKLVKKKEQQNINSSLLSPQKQTRKLEVYQLV